MPASCPPCSRISTLQPSLAAIFLIFAVVMGIILIMFFPIWFQAYMSNANVSIWSLVGMSLRQVNARIIVQGKIMADAGRHRLGSSRPASPPGGWRPITWPAATC